MDTGSRYELLTSFLLGFHGTDAATADAIFAGNTHLAPSENDYDWLGHGIYSGCQNREEKSYSDLCA